MPINPKSLKNLTPNRSPDTAGNTKVIPMRVTHDLFEALAALGGNRQQHLRQALREYLERMKNPQP